MKRQGQTTMDSFYHSAVSPSKKAKETDSKKSGENENKQSSLPEKVKSIANSLTISSSWIGDFNSGVSGYWGNFIELESKKPYFKSLLSFLEGEEKKGKSIFPPRKDVFNAFFHCNWEDLRVVILGQDPYHDDNQAHGLCFSVNRGTSIPPSLRNIYKEINNDLSLQPPKHGYLMHWADQGVLLLNTVLTVEAHNANSHRKKGWESFTDAVIQEINDKKQHVVFILWGNPAQEKGRIVNCSKHLVLKSCHPSPLSANKGDTFFGHHHFSQANAYLIENGMKVIDWSVEE